MREGMKRREALQLQSGRKRTGELKEKGKHCLYNKNLFFYFDKIITINKKALRVFLIERIINPTSTCAARRFLETSAFTSVLQPHIFPSQFMCCKDRSPTGIKTMHQLRFMKLSQLREIHVLMKNVTH